MFKTFGTEEAIFVNQDEGMFVAFPYTFDEAAATLETETIGGRKYVKAGSLVKEGDIVKGITAEAYDITHGPKVGRVVLEGYAWAHKLTDAAAAAANSLPGIVLMPYKKTYVVVSLLSVDGLKAVIRVFGNKFKDTVTAADITVTTLTIAGVDLLENGDLEIEFVAGGTGKITAIADTAFTLDPGAVSGLPIEITVGGN